MLIIEGQEESLQHCSPDPSAIDDCSIGNSTLYTINDDKKIDNADTAVDCGSECDDGDFDMADMADISVGEFEGVDSGDNSTNENEQQLAHLETRAVFRLRFLVMLVLTIAGTAVSVVVYFIARNAELDEFLTQYEGTSQKVLEAFQGIVSQKIGAISSLSVAAIAHVSRLANPSSNFDLYSNFRLLCRC
jgi:hypothetical protein